MPHVLPISAIHLLALIMSDVQCTPYSAHYAMHTLQCTPYSTHPTVHTIQCTPYSTHPTVHTRQCTPYSAHHTVHTLQYTPYSAHHTVHTIQCTPYSTHPTVHTIQCTPYSAHHTVHTLQCTPCSAHHKAAHYPVVYSLFWTSALLCSSVFLSTLFLYTDCPHPVFFPQNDTKFHIRKEKQAVLCLCIFEWFLYVDSKRGDK